ncbi:uncharacterized protein LOC130202835 isoform X3 [Pseudoliparis swirei]|uniref:uncharacterized protein LOC130202835 isoform X3 n=1 Tax=Pseudoliparis swirei TaxID=2059687 RepID=UPI0024BE2EE4|nr:uncharacterized protein LOC130202835 isoform X3 [Pseudoliparis swirei]
MSFLLSEIKRVNRDAARVLETAELRTDSEIQTLTREDLHELFPGPQHFKLRRTLYDVIHNQPIAEQLLKKLKGFLPRESVMAALTNNGVLVDYLQILKDRKTQVDAHIGLLEKFIADQPDSGQTDGCSQEAGGLGISDAFGQNFKQIGPTGPQEPQSLGTSDAFGQNFKQIGPTGPQEPQSLGTSDAFGQNFKQIGSPCPQEPQSLGTSDAIGPNLKQIGPTGPQEPQKHRSGVSAPAGRRDGFQYGATGLGTSDAFGPNFKQIGPTGPQEPLSLGTSDAIGPNFKQIGPTGPQEPQSLGTSDAIGPNLKQSGPTGPQEPQKHHSDASVSAPAGQRDGFQYGATGPSASAPAYRVKAHGGKSDGFQQDTGGEPFIILSVPDVVEPTLLYKMVVGGGKTFGTDRTLMQKVEKPFQNRLRPCGAQDNKITFVFCPISSCIGADVDAAMVDIKDDKPIVLVLMHHTHEVKAVSSMKMRPDDARVVLRVNVFYHETCGLLKCEQNDAAVTEIQNKLEESFIRRSKDRGGPIQGGGADGNYNKLNPMNLFRKPW